MYTFLNPHWHHGTFYNVFLGRVPPKSRIRILNAKEQPWRPWSHRLGGHHDLNDVVNGDGFPDDVFAEGLATKHMEEMAFFMGSLKGSRYSIFCRSMVPIEFLYQQKTILSM